MIPLERLQSLASYHHQTAHQQSECYSLQSPSSEGKFCYCQIALCELFSILIRQFDSQHKMNIHDFDFMIENVEINFNCYGVNRAQYRQFARQMFFKLIAA